MTGERDEPDWLAELARGGESVRRQALPIVRAARQFVDEARAAQANTGSPLPLAQQVALAMDAGIRQVIATVQGEGMGRVVYGSANLTLGLSVVASADVIRATEQAHVVILEESGKATDELSRQGRAVRAGHLLALVLVWLLAFFLPVIGHLLPPKVQSVLTDEYATLALALGITWRMLDQRNR